MSKPVIVWSPRDARHMSGFARHLDVVDTIRLDQFVDGDWPVAYMRTSHFLDEELLASAAIEARLRACGARIINSVDNRILCQRKDLYYRQLSAHYVRVPDFLINPTLPEIRFYLARGWLRWPFLYRSVDGSGGRDMHLVHDEAGYASAVEAVLASGRRGMVAQYIDAKGSGRYFTKRRVYGVFGSVDMAVSDVSDHWNVQRGGRATVEDYATENRPRATPELDLIAVEVGRILGLDVFSMDAVQDSSTGRWFVVDVNPTYVALPAPILLSGDRRTFFEDHFRRVAAKLKELSNGDADL